MSFSENVVVAETSYQKSQVFKSFCYRERALIHTSLIKITVLTFLVNQKYNETLWGIYFWRLREKTFSQIAYSLPFSNLKLSNVILSKVSGTVLYVCYTEMSSNKHLKTPPFLFVPRRACPGGQPICSLLFTFNLYRSASSSATAKAIKACPLVLPRYLGCLAQVF